MRHTAIFFKCMLVMSAAFSEMMLMLASTVSFFRVFFVCAAAGSLTLREGAGNSC